MNVGDAVIIGQGHEHACYIGRRGRIYSITTSAAGEDTAYVRFSDSPGGTWVLLVNLQRQ
jgi:hypothetical protein